MVVVQGSFGIWIARQPRLQARGFFSPPVRIKTKKQKGNCQANFFLTPDIASKNTLPMPRDDRLQSSTPPRVLLCVKCFLRSFFGSFQLLRDPIALPKLSLCLLLKSASQRCGISRANKSRPGIDAEIDQVNRIPRA